MTPSVGSILSGKYRVERVLGRGGMGVVIEALHLQLEQPVAIKFLLPEAAALDGASARFLREARAAARIRSEHVARVLDVDQLPTGEPYMVMEYLVGTDLHRLVREHGPLSIETAVEYVLQACEALAEAHAMGVVHRDLKPSNLFLTRRLDGTALVKLLDFGIAKAPSTWSQPELTRGFLGSPLYMSPEQLRDPRSVDARTDIWSLGVIMHELLTGRFPFEAPSEAALGALVATGAPATLRDHHGVAPEALEKVLLRCLEKEPEKRFANVGALASELRVFAGDRSKASVERIETLSMLVSSSATVLAAPPSAPQSAPTISVTAPAPVSSSVSSPSVSLSSSARTPPPVSQVRVAAASAYTDNFRRQHEELSALGMEIMQMLADPQAVATNAATIRRAVARFAGKLKMHATMENEALYPSLLSHRDPEIRAKARALFEEVEQIYATFGAFATKWPTVDAIAADPVAYSKETRRALKTLWFRMMKENDELYPMVDAVEAAPLSKSSRTG